MRPRTALVLVAVASLGCSGLLEYDDVTFDDGNAPGGSGGATADASPDSVQAGHAGSGGQTAGPEGGDVAADRIAETGTGGIYPDVSTDAPPDPCDGIACSGHGSCQVTDGGQPSCECEPGYHADGLACVEDESCTGVDCGRCGHCEVVDGLATCICPNGFSHTGTRCEPDPDPCDTVDCGAEAACVPEAHCQVLGACVPTCDCSNCGNCGPDNGDGRWNDWQEYCGAEPDQSPATMECNRPCPPGDGCLPFTQPICWPMEGCFSL